MLWLWQIAALNSHPKHVRVHARTGRLKPVTRDVAFINDLVPETCLWILVSFKSLCQLLNNFDQVRSLGLIFGQYLEQQDQRHCIPTEGAPPVKGGLMRRGIGPRLSAALIVCMPQETGRWVVEVLVVDQHLLHYLVICVFAVAKHLTVARKKRQRHKYAVGPQLPGPAGDV